MKFTQSLKAAVAGTAAARSIKDAAFDKWRRTTIFASPYFDPTWYLDRNDDVQRDGVDPFEHFLSHGEREGRDPGPSFDTAAYVTMNEGARGAALTHFHRRLDASDSPASNLRPMDVAPPDLPAVTTRWFDETWYRGTNDLVDDRSSEREHPLVHHLRTGLDPSPLFDHADYQAQLTAAGIDVHPLEHWLAADNRAAHRSIRPRVVAKTTTTAPGYPLVQHRVRPRAELVNLDVAVMIHAFYIDVLPSLLSRLALLPAAPSLLVSVTTSSDAAQAHREIDTVLGSAQPRIVKVVPNRGRNFAPLLCSFATEIREHDYLVHLHTKKSLHMGQDQSAWRRQLVDSQLRSVASVDAILSLLADDPSVGIVQAPTWGPISGYAQRWSGNEAWGSELCQRLGVDPLRADGFVMYPVGGMFWARIDALRPLLDLGLTVGDFEREHGQIDGTLAHAIERIIPAAASAAGCDTVEFDYSAAQWRRNWTPRPNPEAGSTDVEALRAALESADVVLRRPLPRS